MKTFIVTGVMALIASQAFAQTPDSMPPSTRSTATVEADLYTPMGHELSVGVASYTYREPGARALAGKDVIGERWAWSPYTGAGLRHLSNGTTGTPGYRTDDYVYLPVGVTSRTNVASHGALSVNLEFDLLIHPSHAKAIAP